MCFDASAGTLKYFAAVYRKYPVWLATIDVPVRLVLVPVWVLVHVPVPMRGVTVMVALVDFLRGVHAVLRGLPFPIPAQVKQENQIWWLVYIYIFLNLDYDDYDRSNNMWTSNSGSQNGDSRGSSHSPYEINTWNSPSDKKTDGTAGGVHCVHMRGLPFKATQLDVFDVRIYLNLLLF